MAFQELVKPTRVVTSLSSRSGAPENSNSGNQTIDIRECYWTKGVTLDKGQDGGFSGEDGGG